MEDRTDRMLLFMLTGRNLNNVMKDWMPPDTNSNAAPSTVKAADTEDLIIPIKTKKFMS